MIKHPPDPGQSRNKASALKANQRPGFLYNIKVAYEILGFKRKKKHSSYLAQIPNIFIFTICLCHTDTNRRPSIRSGVDIKIKETPNDSSVSLKLLQLGAAPRRPAKVEPPPQTILRTAALGHEIIMTF